MTLTDFQIDPVLDDALFSLDLPAGYALRKAESNIFGMDDKTFLDPETKSKKLSGHYLFVQARKADGTVLPRRIHDDELDKYKDVTVWAEQAELCSQYLRKGSLAGIEGRLRQERWKDKETQANRSKVIIVASTVQFLDSRGRDGDEAGAAHQSHESSQALPDDDIPF